MVIFAVLTVLWLFLTIGTLLLQSKQQNRPLVYQSSQVYQDCTNRVPIVKSSQNSQKTVKTARMTIGVPIVTGLPRLYQQRTNRQKQSNSKKWPLVYQSSHVYTESAEYTKSASASAVRVCVRVRRIHKAQAGEVAHAKLLDTHAGLYLPGGSGGWTPPHEMADPPHAVKKKAPRGVSFNPLVNPLRRLSVGSVQWMHSRPPYAAVC